MQTQHITQTQLPSGLLRLTPDKGYTLFDRKSHRTFPTADIYADDLPNPMDRMGDWHPLSQD